MPRPVDGQPLGRPFGWALIRLDGADTAMLHAVDAGSARADADRDAGPAALGRGARPGGITDIACFEPCERGQPAETAAAAAARQPSPAERRREPVTMITTPVRLQLRPHRLPRREQLPARAGARAG